MADQNEVTLAQYFAAIETNLAAKFPQFKAVVCCPDTRDKLPAYPALTFETTELERAPDADGGEGKLPMDVRVEAHLIFPFNITNIKRLAPVLAANVAQFVHLNRFGLRIEPAAVTGCYEDSFDDALDQFVVWRVEWHQVVDLGESVWAADETFVVPTDVRTVETVAGE